MKQQIEGLGRKMSTPIAFDTAGAGMLSSPKARPARIDRPLIPNKLVSKAGLIETSGGIWMSSSLCRTGTRARE